MDDGQARKMKILIVDDDDRICKIMSAFLRKRDYSIVTSFNGQGGLDLFYEELPDMAIIDILLPDTMGTEVFAEIRESSMAHADIPVVLMSGISDVARKHYLSMCPYAPSAVLSKPFHLRHLLAIIEDLGDGEGSSELDVEELEAEAIDLLDEEVLPISVDHTKSDDHSSISRTGVVSSVPDEQLLPRPVNDEFGEDDTNVDQLQDIDEFSGDDPTQIEVVSLPQSEGFVEYSRKDLVSLLDKDDAEPRFLDGPRSISGPGFDQLGHIPQEFLQETSELFFETRTTGLFAPGSIDLKVSHLPPDLYGDIELADLFFVAFKDEFTGRLEIQNRTFQKEIYFYKGHAIFAASNLRRETFGDWLLFRGLISKSQHEQCLSLMMEEKCRYGEALVSLDFFTHQQLFQYLKEQCRDRIVETFQWRNGVYRMYPDEAVAAKVTMYELNMVAMIAEGLLKYSRLSNLLIQFNHAMGHYVNRKPNYYKFATDLTDYHLFQKLQTQLRRSPQVKHLLTRSDLDLISVLRGLKMLVVLDMISIDEKPLDDKQLNEQMQFVPSDTQPLRDERLVEGQHVESILKDYLQLKEANFYDLLGVTPESTLEQIEERYKEVSTNWAPESFTAIGDRKILGKIKEIHQKIQLAYRVLANQKSRSRYSRHMDQAEHVDHQELLGGEVAFMKGKGCLERREFDGAVKNFEEAVKSNPGEADYIVYLGWATFLQKPTEVEVLKDAVSWMKKALVLNPESSDAYYFLGLIALKAGKIKYARRYLTKCISINPEHHPAQKAITSLEKYEQ